MKSKKISTIPAKRPPANLRIMPRREPRHPVIGTLPMSLARALSEPPVEVDEEIMVEEIEDQPRAIRRRKAA